MAFDQKGAAMVKLAIEGNEAAQRAAYLDYVNNFLTVAGFAQYYGIGQSSAEVYLKWWKDVHESYCAVIKELEGKAPVISSVRLLIGANAYACVTHDAGQTDIKLSAGKSAQASLREYAAECLSRANRETEKANLATLAADFLDSKES